MTATNLPHVTSVGAMAVGRATFDLELGDRMVTAACDLLGIDRVEIATDDAAVSAAIDRVLDGEPDLVVVLQATFSDARPVIELAEQTSRPCLVWSFPEPRTGERLRLNSLCGANLAAYSLRRRRHPVTFLHHDPFAGDAVERLRDALAEAIDPTTHATTATPADAADGALAASAARIADELSATTVGIIGDAPDGFEPCEEPTPGALRRLGVDVDRIVLEELFDAAGDADTTGVTERIEETLTVTDEARAHGLAESVQLYAGLGSLVRRRGWSAVATRCWPECMTEYGGAVCTPQAMLTEDGVPGVCEADVLGSVTALVLQRVAGSDPFVADLVDAADDGTSVLWHCGVASAALADPTAQPVGVTHPNRHRALVSQFALAPGRVTMARLSQAGPAGDDRPTMVVGTGTVLARPRPFTGTCGVVEWDAPIERVLDTVFGVGLEHHVGVVYGDHRAMLLALAHHWRIPVLELGGPMSVDAADQRRSAMV